MPYSDPAMKVANNKKYRLDHPDQIARYQKVWTENNRQKRRSYNKKYYVKARIEALQHYSGKSPLCACCGEPRLPFLVIDHVDGGGHQHRKTLGVANIYIWLRLQNYPKGFRVLCHNCNMALGLYDQCPHQAEIRSAFE